VSGESQGRERYAPLVLVETADLPRDDWLNYRRRGIGGSDVAAIMGVSPFRTARDIYYDKLNIAAVEPDDSNWVALEVGHLLEDLVARIFQKKTGLRVYQIKKMFYHPVYQFMLADVDYTAKLIRTFADGTTEEVAVPESQWTALRYNGEDYYQVKYNNFAAKEMLDEISIQIFDADGKAVSNIFTDSIREYAMFALGAYTDAAYAEFRTAMVDMLNYGAAAQKQFGYNTGDLANSELSAEQQAQATQSVTLEDHWTNPDGIGHGSNLELISNIVLHVWLKGVTSDMYAEVSYTNHTGTAVKNTVAFSEFTYRGSGIYSVPVDGLVVADGGQVATVKLYKADGTLVGTVTESIESYIKFQLTIGDANGLYDATAKFITSAYNYFH